jgi:hypothetical protein
VEKTGQETKLSLELYRAFDVFNPENTGILLCYKATDHIIDLIEGIKPPFESLYPLS